MKSVQKLREITNSIVFRTDKINGMKKEIDDLKRKIAEEEVKVKELTNDLKNISADLDKEVSKAVNEVYHG